jgi:adenylate cyclase
MAQSRRPSIVVLLVDDQLIIAERIRELLATESYIAVHHCQNSVAAFDAATTVKPTVILQDLMMPGVDGLEVLQQLKQSPSTREVPVVVLSTKEDPAIKAKAFRVGANDYLIKLPSAVELIARLRYHSEAFRNETLRQMAMQALTESREELRRSHEQIARQAVVLETRNRFITKTFGRYLSDEVVNQLLESPEGLKLGGENRVVTIMLADLRGFTAISDKLPATDVVRMLNGFLAAMSRVITAHQGTIDKFMGDAVMAIFGAPVSREDDALRAARCAIEMHHALQTVNDEHRSSGLPILDMGVALHTGEVVVGNIGSDLRTEYSVIGSNVNLAARIESLSVGGQVLISDATRQAIGLSAITGHERRFQAKGFQREMCAWELLGIDGSNRLLLPTRSGTQQTFDPPRPLQLWLTKNKHASGPPATGVMISASEYGARIRTEIALPEFTEVRVLLSPDEHNAQGTELWARVMQSDGQGVLLQFSGVSQIRDRRNAMPSNPGEGN